MIIYVLICISLIFCLIAFIFVTIDYINSRRIYKQFYKTLSKKDYNKLKEKEKEKYNYYGIFH